MEIKMDSDKALTLLLELAVHNLCTIRKLSDVVITLQNFGKLGKDWNV
jgi:hypothetical protein